ncbi:MAG: hypothetical protein H0V51_21530, partial [Chloroflexi bacterium]|nr:hypothetical protein [Chloroflexota bacterium]
ILAAQTRKMPIDPNVDLGRLASASEGLSGADLAAVCQRAAMQAIRTLIQAERRDGALPAGALRIGHERFEEALAEIRRGLVARPSPSPLRLPRGVPLIARPARPS